MAEAAGLAARGTVQRAEQVTARLLRELPAAVEEVAAMPAGPSMLEVFAKEIEERATEVRAHAGQEGVTDAPESATEDPASDATAYHG
jgi:serine/threonine-protein kinase HipA